MVDPDFSAPLERLTGALAELVQYAWRCDVVEELAEGHSVHPEGATAHAGS